MQHGLFPGYVAPVGKELAKDLWRRGIDVAVAVIGGRSPSAESEPLDFPIHCIEKGNVIDTYRRVHRVVRDFDIVHYYPNKGLELLPLLTPHTKFIFNRLSVSVTGHPVRDRLLNIVKRCQPFFASHVVFTDEPLAIALRPFGRKPVSILPVGYASDLFYPCASYAARTEKLLIYHGAVRPQRDLDQLVKVLSRLPLEYRMMIIGGGLAADEAYKRHLAALAAELGCAGRLTLTNMPQAAIRAEIENAYLCLSHVPMWECYQDQFVLKTVEYLACHRPVLTTATRYSKKFSETLGANRLLLTDGSVDDMLKQICDADDYIRSFYEPENLRSLSSSLAPYSTEYVVENSLLPIYRSVLNGDETRGECMSTLGKESLRTDSPHSIEPRPKRRVS